MTHDTTTALPWETPPAEPTSDRIPYVGEGADGARRSAEIDRNEADTLDPGEARDACLASAAAWDAQAERLEEETLVDATGTLVAVTDVEEVDRFLDDLRDDATRSETVRAMRDTVLDAVRRRSDTRHAARVKRLDGAAPESPTDVRLEVVGAADDADSLAALAAVFAAGAKEAKGIAGEILDELPGRGGKPRGSLRVGDGQGFELVLTRSGRRDLSVEVDEVVDVLVADLVAQAEKIPNLEKSVAIYSTGIRDGVKALRDLLSSTPSFRSTALDAFVKRLENRDDDDLAKRLRKAYGRVESGEPSIKLDRKPIEETGDES